MHRLKVTRLDHVTITTPEELEADTVSWYADCLGLERVEKPPGLSENGAWFKAGEQQVHVSRDEHMPPKKAHFCMVVDDLDAAIEQVRGAGCHIEQAMDIPGRRRFFTRDPVGNRIELMTYQEG